MHHGKERLFHRRSYIEARVRRENERRKAKKAAATLRKHHKHSKGSHTFSLESERGQYFGVAVGSRGVQYTGPIVSRTAVGAAYAFREARYESVSSGCARIVLPFMPSPLPHPLVPVFIGCTPQSSISYISLSDCMRLFVDDAIWGSQSSYRDCRFPATRTSARDIRHDSADCLPADLRHYRMRFRGGNRKRCHGFSPGSSSDRRR